jgi:hypothetical protein
VDQYPGSKGNTFIVRIWREWSEAGSCWRGQIEHLQSKQKCAFLNLEEIVTFIQGYVTMPVRKDNLLKGGGSRKNSI